MQGSPRNGHWSRSVMVWWSAALGSVLLGYLLVLHANSRFFLQDDSEGWAVPNWLFLGDQLHHGHLPVLTPSAWMAGAWTVEGQDGLWNPAQLLVYYVAPMVDRLDLLAAGVKIIFGLVLAWGVFRVVRVYGGGPAWAAVAAAAAPFTGFLLYYDTATWVSSLFGTAWLLHAWASLVRYARGRSGPLAAFAFTYLALSVGYVHTALEMGSVAACVAGGEWVYARGWRPASRVAAVAAAAALCGSLTYLPGALSASVTWRHSGVFNDTFLTAPWSETLNLTVPTALPAVRGFQGVLQRVPSTYVAWFVLPGLCFVDWGRVRALVRLLSGPLALLTVMLLATDAPSQVGPLRWPARMLPLVAITILVLTALLLSLARSTTGTRRRLAAVAVVVALATIRAVSADPAQVASDLAWAALVLAAAYGVVLLGASHPGAAAATLLASVALVVAVQSRIYPTNGGVRQWSMPRTRSQAVSGFAHVTGETLQLGSYTAATRNESPAATWSSLVFGNYARTLGVPYVNHYTPVGHTSFASLLCMTYDGSTCPGAYKRLFEREPATGLTYADLMALDRLVLPRAVYRSVGSPPPGWRLVPGTPLTWVLQRDTSPPAQGGVTASPGVRVTRPVASSDTVERLRVSSPGGGKVVFARLSWPGYTATLAGRPVPVRAVQGIFVAVPVPRATVNAPLTLRYTPPGLPTGLALAALGVAAVVALTAVDVRPSRTRAGRAPPGTAAGRSHPIRT